MYFFFSFVVLLVSVNRTASPLSSTNDFLLAPHPITTITSSSSFESFPLYPSNSTGNGTNYSHAQFPVARSSSPLSASRTKRSSNPPTNMMTATSTGASTIDPASQSVDSSGLEHCVAPPRRPLSYHEISFNSIADSFHQLLDNSQPSSTPSDPLTLEKVSEQVLLIRNFNVALLQQLELLASYTNQLGRENEALHKENDYLNQRLTYIEKQTSNLQESLNRLYTPAVRRDSFSSFYTTSSGGGNYFTQS